MMLSIHEIQPGDVRHLHCTDPRVADEVEAVNRSLHRLDEGIPTWCYVEPELGSRNDARTEVAA